MCGAVLVKELGKGEVDRITYEREHDRQYHVTAGECQRRAHNVGDLMRGGNLLSVSRIAKDQKRGANGEAQTIELRSRLTQEQTKHACDGNAVYGLEEPILRAFLAVVRGGFRILLAAGAERKAHGDAHEHDGSGTSVGGQANVREKGKEHITAGARETA